MLFSEQFDPTTLSTRSYTQAEIENTLRKKEFGSQNFPILISSEMRPHLEELAQRSHLLTQQRFGNTMQLFIPLYLSNLCFNKCTYCGFSIEHTYPRVTLTRDEILKEGDILHQKGFQHLLLLTGEAPKEVGVGYISEAIRLLKPQFSSIGVEIQPMTESDYRILIKAGADSITLYQETYHPESYSQYHLSGKKKFFKNRLDAVDEAGKAGFYRLNLGALLGLYEWRFEALALAQHLTYLQTNYWKTKYSVSFPRIRDMIGSFQQAYPVTDTDIVQFICAFRLAFPDVGITLSTRESADIRDRLVKLGITSMSAESHTEPGGYSGKEAEKQFEISDTRSLEEVKNMLIYQGFEPVMKDWEAPCHS